jgi:hypothetical protein
MYENPDIKQAILSAASERGAFKTTCPSEIARALFPQDWRKHMGDIRDAAIELRHEGKVVISQKGKPIDTGHIKGPIRIGIGKAKLPGQEKMKLV